MSCRGLRGLLFSIAAVEVLAAQQPEGAAFATLPSGHELAVAVVKGQGADALAVAWPHPTASRPEARRGLAHAAALFRARAADLVLPPGAMTSFEVGEDATVFAVVLDGEALRLAPRWIGALAAAAAAVPAAADGLAVALARAALAADDAEWLYPGEIFASAARRAFGFASLRGSAAELQNLPPATFAAALASPPAAPLRVAIVGGGTSRDAVAEALAAIAVATVAAGQESVAASAPNAAVVLPAPEWLPHPRVDAAYCAAAVAAPRADIRFALGIAVLRGRADSQFGDNRGRESLARAPFVQFDGLQGDPIVLFCRRSRGALVDSARGEITSLLDGMLTVPPSGEELRRAQSLLLAEWAVPPWSPVQAQLLAEVPPAMRARATALCWLRLRSLDGVVTAAITQATPETVHAAVAPCLAPARRWWTGLVPLPGLLTGETEGVRRP